MAELVVALDYPDLKQALCLVESLQGRVSWFKIGLELFTLHGPNAVHAVLSRGAKVFLDLKLMDIPNTVRAAARAATSMNVGMFTIHLSGGERMVQAALQGRDETLGSGQVPPLVLGVTLLTSLSRPDIAWMIDRDPGGIVRDMARFGRQWGVDGLVCSVQEVLPIKKLIGSSWRYITPGIRTGLQSMGLNDQMRTATPAEAVAAGADYLVVGRPITTANDPLRAADEFLAAMNQSMEEDSRS